jgi:hypothetical protein
LTISTNTPYDSKARRLIFRAELGPTQPSLRSNIDHDYVFELPFWGAGRSTTVAVINFTP